MEDRVGTIRREKSLETVAGWVQQPRVGVGALHAGEETESFAGQFSGVQRAGVGQRAEGLALDVALLLPLLEVAQRVELGRVLHPLDDLQHRDEENVISSQHLFDKLDQLFAVFFLRFQPRCVEVEAERCAVAIVVTVEVVAQKTSELLAALDVRARVNHVATGQRLVEGRVVATIQLVHDHLPNGVASRWAVVSVAVALVRHAEVESVGPDWHAAQRSGDGCVVNEKLIGHHLELFIAANTQIWSTNADDAAVSNVGKALDNQTGASHLRQPIVVRSLRPIFWLVLVGEREDRDLVAATVQVLDGRVVCVFVRDEESSADLTAVGVLALAVEDVLVQVDVVDVDGAVERDGDHLRHLRRLDVAGNAGAVGRAEAIGEDALGGVAVGRSVRVSLDG